MAKHAGFALTQGLHFGRIDYWNYWNPTDIQTKWLLLSGSSDPPKAVQVSERRPRGEAKSKDGPFLKGMNRDFVSMTEGLIRNGLELFSSLNKLRITTRDAKKEIKDIFDTCKAEGKKAVLYYTGHGEIGTGNWCFRDGTISIEDLENLTPPGCFYPFIISDCCYSGHWADYCLKKGIDGFHCLAACPHFSTAIDIDAKGGELTCYITDQINRNDLSKTPVCSRKDDESCPFERVIESFSNLFSAYLTNSTRIVKCHTIANGKLSAIFTEKGSRSERAWACSKNLKRFEKTMDGEWEEGRICSSFACDDSNFLMFFEKDGARQLWRSGNTDYIRTEISKARDENMMKITGCGAYNSSWIIIMTSGVRGSDIWTICSSWDNCFTFINRKEEKGYRTKGICFNITLKQYFLFMRKTKKRTKAKWFQEGQLKEARRWLRKNKKDYQVDFIFKDPTDSRTYIGLEEIDSPYFYLDLAFDFFQCKQ